MGSKVDFSQFASGGVKVRIGAEETQPVFFCARPSGANCAGTFSDQCGGGDIPEVESGFKITVRAAAGDMAEINGRRTEYPDFICTLCHIAEKSEGAWVDIFSETREESCFSKRWDVGDMNRLTVAESWAVNGGRIAFILNWNKNTASQYFAVTAYGDRAAP